MKFDYILISCLMNLNKIWSIVCLVCSFDKSQSVIKVDNKIRYRFILMEGSRIESKAPWKQTIVKNNQSNSRIFNQSREMFSKYSPTKDTHAKNTAKSLIKNKSAHFSVDEIPVSPQGNKDNSVAYQLNRQELKPTTNKGYKAGNKAILPSNVDAEFFQNLKQEFNQFKEKILKELSKQQQLIKKTIKDICDVLKKVNPKIESQLKIPSFGRVQTKALTKSFSVEPMKMQESFKINHKAYRGQPLIDSKPQFQSILPQIKQKMSKLSEFVQILKKQASQNIFESNLMSSSVKLMEQQMGKEL